MKNKTLSEKRKQLFDKELSKDNEKELFAIFNCIADQDKEFIKDILKERGYIITPVSSTKRNENWKSRKVIDIESIDKLTGMI